MSWWQVARIAACRWIPPRCRAVLMVLILSLCTAELASAAAAGGLLYRDRRTVVADLHLVGPPLTALRTKLADPRWLVAWLLKPSRLRRHSLMRNFNVGVEEARAMAAYLYGAGPPPPGNRAVHWRGGNAGRGKRLFVTRGCRGCHAIEPEETSPMPRVPHLAGTGIKVRGDWLFNWLKSPRAYDPDTAMPRLVLTGDEIRDLVAFLLSHREGADVVAATPTFTPSRSPAVARAAIERFDCAKCHLINGVQAVEPTTGWRFAPPSCANCHAPSGSGLSLARSPQVTGDDRSRMRQSGQLLIAYYNCRGCHRIKGRGGIVGRYLERKTFAPPTLDGEGARVQTSWLIKFLQRPTNLRPWLGIRMPDYGLSKREATVLAKYFAALARIPAVDEAHDAPPSRTIALGRRRFTHFKCIQCHLTGTGAALPKGVDPEDLAIDLTLAATRLRPSWIRDFLARPKALVGRETRMPAIFYTSDGIPKVDHPKRDITAVTAYLLEMAERPVASAGNHGRRQQTPATDWTTYPY
ncbi:MAG: c-type cytochrome [Candidatus Binatia bacterium]